MSMNYIAILFEIVAFTDLVKRILVRKHIIHLIRGGVSTGSPGSQEPIDFQILH